MFAMKRILRLCKEAVDGEGESVLERRYCVLEDGKLCDDCGQCRVCDLDPNKICDNCMKCVNTGAEYNAIEIDEVFESEETPGYSEDELSQVWRAAKPEEKEEDDGASGA